MLQTLKLKKPASPLEWLAPCWPLPPAASGTGSAAWPAGDWVLLGAVQDGTLLGADGVCHLQLPVRLHT